MISLFCIVLHVECWIATTNFHGFGGTPRDIDNVTECQAACISYRSCVAVDWDPTNTGSTCWILTSLEKRATTGNVEFVHYELKPRCRG